MLRLFISADTWERNDTVLDDNYQASEIIPRCTTYQSGYQNVLKYRCEYVMSMSCYSFTEYSYHYHTDTVTRDEAAARCNADGMELMTPSSQAAIDVVRSTLGQQIGNKQVWSGLMKSGVPTSSPLWRSGEPSGDGNCVTLNLRGSWQLNDLRCMVKIRYVCQMPGEVHVYFTVKRLSALFGFLH